VFFKLRTLQPSPSFIYVPVLFRPRMALTRAETCSELVWVITFTYNKRVVIDFIYLLLASTYG
jgi:hypothetical protein